jgi:hypothetical protein
LSLEAFSKDTLSDWFHEKQITSKFAVAALLLSDEILDSVRLQIRRLSQVRVDIDELRSLLTEEVIKRELIDGDDAKSASGFLKKMQRRMNAKRDGSDDEDDESEPSAQSSQSPANNSVKTSAASAEATVISAATIPADKTQA